MVVVRIGLIVCMLLVASVLLSHGPVASAQPDVPAPPVPAPSDGVPATPVAAPNNDIVEPGPPARTKTPDGWELTITSKEETRVPTAPLTTALSSREFLVGGMYMGSLVGPAGATPPRGVLEVGYQIGCGIDMSTSQGVTLTGSVGVTSSLGLSGVDVGSPLPGGFLPVVTVPVTGGIAVGLKPGLVNMVPVSKKEYKGADPWVMISGFRVKIDGCVGQSFIRSYAVLTKSTDSSDVVLGYYGTTKIV